MSFSKPVASEATKTWLRTRNSYSPFSGMCTVCDDSCPGTCEIAQSAIRGREILYPQPFGHLTAASEKDYPLDYSHFNINGTAVGAVGIEADSDQAIFPRVNLGMAAGNDDRIKLAAPLIFAAQGSTQVAKDNWEGYAIGAALSGVMVVVGENVCGMDPELETHNGRVVRSPDLEARVNSFRRWHNGHGMIAVQTNVEDTFLGTAEYAVEKLGVRMIELKWGQGAKNIGGEVKLPSLERAMQLKERGYIVLPDPTNAQVQRAYKKGAFSEFERHSRVGMVDEEAFHARVEQLRSVGARYIALKTGAYRPADLARAVKYASDAKLDLLTVDGAGGGTGMSPWRMMNEWGIPTVYLQALLHGYLDRLARRGRHVPDVAIAGGFTLEDQVFKALAMGAPYINLVAMGRAPMTAAMVGRTVARLIQEGNVPKQFKGHGETVDRIYVGMMELEEKLGDTVRGLPPAAIAVYTYVNRLRAGLQQLMAGARKFSLSHISRDDVCSLTREAAEVTGIRYVMDLDREAADEILA